MKRLLSLVLCMLSVIAVCSAQSTSFVEYKLSTTWSSAAGAQSFTKSVHGPNSGSDSYSASLPYRFVCDFWSSDVIDIPVASGSATVKLTEQATTGALIIGSTGTATATAACGSVSSSSSQSGGGADPHSNGPTAIPGLVISGSTLLWAYDAVNDVWTGVAPLVTISFTGDVHYTKAGNGDARDQATAVSTVANGSMGLITSNTISVSQ